MTAQIRAPTSNRPALKPDATWFRISRCSAKIFPARSQVSYKSPPSIHASLRHVLRRELGSICSKHVRIVRILNSYFPLTLPFLHTTTISSSFSTFLTVFFPTGSTSIAVAFLSRPLLSTPNPPSLVPCRPADKTSRSNTNYQNGLERALHSPQVHEQCAQ